MDSLRNILQQEFIRRTSSNPKYSLRAYARHLGIYHATLSALISGKRKITYKTARVLSAKLGLDPVQLQDLSADGEQRATSYFNLQQDAFNAIAEWHFDAILEMTRIKSLRLTPKTISEAIGVSVVEARLAVETLLRLELIHEVAPFRYALSQVNTTNILDPDFTSAAMKKYQRKILQKSMESIDEVQKSERDHTSVTMAIRKSDLPKAKEIMKRFRSELNSYLQREKINFDEVYQLQISFFPITNLKNKGRS